MADHLTPEQRSDLMGKVTAKDTAPEMTVRRLLHGAGYRYRLHRKELPGKPDIVFASRKKVIFVHGCFWHQHECSKAKRPATNTEFWKEKLDRNIERDGHNLTRLAEMEWGALVIWECETKQNKNLLARLEKFLG